MSVHIILVTHDKVGKALLAATAFIFGKLPLPTTDVSVTINCNIQQLHQQLLSLVTQLQNPAGILLLTDVFGASPHNIVSHLPKQDNTRIVTGVNLPMLLKIMNYADLPLNELAQKALLGGQQGIMACDV